VIAGSYRDGGSDRVGQLDEQQVTWAAVEQQPDRPAWRAFALNPWPVLGG
jgi:hypothetical protein